MEFQKIDIKTREYLLSNNENFPMILEEELKRVRAYKIDENVNAEKILNDRRTKFNMKYFLKRINKAESKIDKFALLQEAIGNNLVFIHAYKDPYNYTKYFEQQMYIKAGFLTEN
ncbi:hypothetical protein [Mycoplasma testudineum]|nr:hypothetical protein [Mycoplasma testudineum]